MKEDAKKKWVQALRSGEYKQGKYRLRTGNTFCCLGVLCHLMNPDGWQKSTTYPGQVSYVGFDGVLPDHIIQRLEIGRSCDVSIDEIVSRDGHRPTLTGMNDKGMTFEQIADVIDHFL